MSEILTRSAGGIRTITINRVPKKNSFTGEMYSAFAEALDLASADDSVRVVVIRGDKQVFSAGNDIKDFLEHPPTGSDDPVVRFLAAISSFPKPLVAAVCGPAVGIGTTMLLHCDLVVAGENAVFSLPFVNLGLSPEAASSYLLPRLVGYRRAAEALLLGGRIGAAEALAMGLVNRVLATERVAAEAEQIATQLAEQPITSVIATKRLLKSGDQQFVSERMAEEFELFAVLLREPAAKEAFSAFLEGRAPDFRTVGE